MTPPEPVGALQGQEERCSLWVTTGVTAASSGSHTPGQALGALQLESLCQLFPAHEILIVTDKETEAQKAA